MGGEAMRAQCLHECTIPIKSAFRPLREERVCCWLAKGHAGRHLQKCGCSHPPSSSPEVQS